MTWTYCKLIKVTKTYLWHHIYQIEKTNNIFTQKNKFQITGLSKITWIVLNDKQQHMYTNYPLHWGVPWEMIFFHHLQPKELSEWCFHLYCQLFQQPGICIHAETHWPAPVIVVHRGFKWNIRVLCRLINIIIFYLSFSIIIRFHINKIMQLPKNKRFHESKKAHKFYLNFSGKCCTEHKRLPLSRTRHFILQHNPSDLWLKSHVQHPICLIQDQISAIKIEMSHKSHF